MTTIRLLTLILSLAVQNCYSQSPDPDSLFNKFKNDIEIEQREYDGVVSMDDETKASYYSLVIKSSVTDLIRYANDSNPFVRTFVFTGLLRRQVSNDMLLRIVEKHKNDTVKFTSRSADVVVTWSVGDFIQAGWQLKLNNKLPQINYKKELERLKKEAASNLKIESISHGTIEKINLLKIDSLAFTNDEFRVISFTLFNGEQLLNSSGNKLTNEMKDLIQNAAPGSFIVFGNIKVAAQNGKTRHLASLKLKLK